ncbi:MAG: hypothetical protein H6722_13970 [Sandaracinus sp.]|nr:hypothetical protein [Sandaracinus sp.]MCB9613550.1 hypothetical protein [Sandaracinus sp.]MCB9619686.1 hypothetical protein [Sandaracinus sp.]
MKRRNVGTSARVRIATSGPMVIAEIRGAPSVEELEWIRRTQREHARLLGGPVAMVSFLHFGPGAEARFGAFERKTAARLLRSMHDDVLCGVKVLRVDGFAAAAIRAVLAAVAQLAGRPPPSLVTTDLLLAARFVSKHLQDRQAESSGVWANGDPSTSPLPTEEEISRELASLSFRWEAEHEAQAFP